MANMQDDHYDYYGDRFEMVGNHTGKTYKLGQKVLVEWLERTVFHARLILNWQEEEDKMAKSDGKLIANNKKAYHDYFILESFEAGIALHGTE